jgi:hypothetical protein
MESSVPTQSRELPGPSQREAMQINGTMTYLHTILTTLKSKSLLLLISMQWAEILFYLHL